MHDLLHADMEEWVEAMIEADGYQFGVVVVQKNGMLHTNREVCTLDVNAHNLQLRLPNDLVLQQPYTAAMQVGICSLLSLTIRLVVFNVQHWRNKGCLMYGPLSRSSFISSGRISGRTDSPMRIVGSFFLSVLNSQTRLA